MRLSFFALPFFYGWFSVAVAFVTMGIGVNARTAFSLLFPPILDEFGWARGLTAGAFLYLMVASQGVLGCGLASVFGAIPAELFQGKHYGTIFGALSLRRLSAAPSVPGSPARVHDYTGSYVLAFWIAIGASIVSPVAMWLAAPRKVRAAVAGRVPRDV